MSNSKKITRAAYISFQPKRVSEKPSDSQDVWLKKNSGVK